MMLDMLEDLYCEPPLSPLFTHQFTGLVSDKHVTNCSLLRYRGRLLLAYRVGWTGARIWIAELADDFTVKSNTLVVLDHPLCVGGQEDPRLFVSGGFLCLSFIGVRVLRDEATVARQLVATLNGSLQPVSVHEPQYKWTTQWEKNWQFFDREDACYAVYSLNPWRVLRLEDGQAEPVLFAGQRQAKGIPWAFGKPRGGASPVRVGDEWYCFFHGTEKHGYAEGDKPSIYTMGVCTFDAHTLLPKRATRSPIMWPDIANLPAGEHGRHKTWYAATVFPCGAILENGMWLISYGSNDHVSRVSGFRFTDVENVLCPL